MTPVIYFYFAFFLVLAGIIGAIAYSAHRQTLRERRERDRHAVAPGRGR